MTPEQIKTTIENAIPGCDAHVMDPMNDGQHLQAVVISETFRGMPLVRQHKMVMTPLKEALGGAVHALGLRTLTPEQWKLTENTTKKTEGSNG